MPQRLECCTGSITGDFAVQSASQQGRDLSDAHESKVVAGDGIEQRSTTNSFSKCVIPVRSQELLRHNLALPKRAPPLLLLAVSLTVFCSRGFLRNARMMDLSESCVLRVLQGVDRLEVEAIIWPA